MANKVQHRGHGTRKFPLKKNYCFACGKDNPAGMHLKFTFDQPRKRFVSNFRLSKRYTGPPGFCHGGIIATILDDAMSKLNKQRDVAAATAQLTIEYLRPVPLQTSLRVEAHDVGRRGRRLTRTAEILDQSGNVLAKGRGVFVIINPMQVFKRN
jgi:uncharacterized protein (TIGR00369 family)